MVVVVWVVFVLVVVTDESVDAVLVVALVAVALVVVERDVDDVLDVPVSVLVDVLEVCVVLVTFAHSGLFVYGQPFVAHSSNEPSNGHCPVRLFARMQSPGICR